MKKLEKREKDLLWTSRWLIQDAIEKDKRSSLITAIDTLEEALKLYDQRSVSIMIEAEEEPARPDKQPPIVTERPLDEIWEPNIVRLKGVRWKIRGQYQTHNKMPEGIIGHYTVSGRSSESAIGVAKYFEKEGLACPIMDASGVIYVAENFDILKDWGYHAGVSKHLGKTSLSKYYLGIEMCSWGLLDKTTKPRVHKDSIRKISKNIDNIKKGEYEAFTEKQEREFLNICRWLHKKCEWRDFKKVTSHDEVAPARKSDMGGSYSKTITEIREVLSRG